MNESEDVLPSISFSNSDGMSLNSLTRSSPLKDSNEENSTNTEIKKMTENIECDASIMNVEEGKCMFTLPYPDGNFKCPHCINFRTNSLEEMRDHIFAEENYDRCFHNNKFFVLRNSDGFAILRYYHKNNGCNNFMYINFFIDTYALCVE